MNVVILVPRRDDNGWRDQLWKFCRKRWEENFPDWPICEGYHTADEGPFNRSLAINRAAPPGDSWDVALIIDSDTISDPDAVRRAVTHAYETNALSIAHDTRYMTTKRGAEHIMSGRGGDWKRKPFVRTTYHDSVSCAVAVSRTTFDMVGGFDERFVGWGFEDTAFRVAVETLTDQPMHLERSDCFHLWHPTSPEADKNSPTWSRNHALKRRYEVAHWQPDRVRAILDGEPDPGFDSATIPKILHRTVPKITSSEVEKYWDTFGSLHPAWDLRTYREPIDPADWPMTGDLFEKCQNGAQKAGLIRLEVLFTHGGVYVDSDVEPYRPLDSLTHVPAFAGWEDEKVVPDAVIGAAKGHPAIREAIVKARRLVELGEDAWKSGPGVTTEVFPERDDVLLLPPGAFYPAHYLEKARLGKSGNKPWVFMEHKWHHSWGTKEQHASNQRRQRVKNSEVSFEMPSVSVTICMPWRDNNDPQRREAHNWCTHHWRTHGFEIVEGDGENRAEMCNNAAQEAIDGGAEYIVIADADTWTSGRQLVDAINKSIETGRLVHAFDDYFKADASTTQRMIRRKDATIEMISRKKKGITGHVSGLSVIPVDLWNQIGGFDERFTEWGLEDRAFDLAADVVGGGVERVEGQAIHWFHRPDPKSRRGSESEEAVELIQKYCEAAGKIPSVGRIGRLGREKKIVVPDGAEPSKDVMIQVLSAPRGPLGLMPPHQTTTDSAPAS